MKPLHLLAIACLAWTGCNSGYTLTGNIPDLEAPRVYLCTMEDYPADLTVLDSAKVENGLFAFEGKVEHSTLGYLSLDARKPFTSFILENAPIRIEGTLADRKSFTAASPLNDSLARFQEQMKTFSERRNAVRGSKEQCRAVWEEQYDYTYRTVVANADNFLAVRILSRYPLNFRSPHELLDAIDRLSEPMQQYYMIRRHLKPQVERQVRTAEGETYFDIEAENPAGETVSLRQAVENPANNYVLVDFWASWCGPCMGEMNHLKELYEKYRPAGLEIYGVSLDSQRQPWIEAIGKKQMPWINVSNLDGWETGLKSYGVMSLPSYVLIRCSDGRIVARMPKGTLSGAPTAEIEELLGK